MKTKVFSDSSRRFFVKTVKGEINMNKIFANLQLHQMDLKLAKIREHRPPIRPSIGWVKAIRESLGMSASALARKLEIRPHSVGKLEKAEADERITLATLRKLANALDCELQYTLVPRKPLEKILWERALTLAQERLSPISHSMSLEDQSLEKEATKKQLQILAKEILNGSRRKLW
jgi:predicted DNA-binding mobile mystery protein A